MRLAIWQARAEGIGPDTVLERIGPHLEAAAHAGAAMLVVPELVFPGYNRPHLHATHAEPRDGALMAAVARMTRTAGCGLTFGWAERDGAAIYNAATAIDTGGRQLAHYRKRALFGEMGAASFSAGTVPPELLKLGPFRVALLICYDVECPDQPRVLADRGADLVLVPIANPARFGHVPTVVVPARAYDNRQIIAYANYCGTDDGLAFGGGSLIAAPDGRAIVSAGVGEALLIADLPPATSYDAESLSPAEPRPV